jgi:hypothetical protein
MADRAVTWDNNHKYHHYPKHIRQKLHRMLKAGPNIRSIHSNLLRTNTSLRLFLQMHMDSKTSRQMNHSLQHRRDRIRTMLRHPRRRLKHQVVLSFLLRPIQINLPVHLRPMCMLLQHRNRLVINLLTLLATERHLSSRIIQTRLKEDMLLLGHNHLLSLRTQTNDTRILQSFHQR